MMPEFPPPALVRIDFVSFEPYGLTVDGRAGIASFPFTIHVSAPYRPWAVMAASTLHRWAATNQEVRLEIRRGRDGPQARLADGLRLVVLDLRAAPQPLDFDLSVLPAPDVG